MNLQAGWMVVCSVASGTMDQWRPHFSLHSDGGRHEFPLHITTPLSCDCNALSDSRSYITVFNINQSYYLQSPYYHLYSLLKTKPKPHHGYRDQDVQHSQECPA